MSRPEDNLPPDLFYNDTESRKYTTSSRIQSIQASMTNRALELLSLTKPSLILDIGCGSGLSGEILSEADPPHTWIGMDISPSMLAVALDREVDGDLLLGDMGQGLPFRAGTFDAAISISAIQWLCNEDEKGVDPKTRLSRFFDSLYASLRRDGKAVCQFYPRDDKQRDMICSAAIKAGFAAGLLEDDPETKNRKLYLVLEVGGEGNKDITSAVQGMEGVDVYDNRKKLLERAKGEAKKGTKAWIMKKKEQERRKGKIVKADSKYTGRKRNIKF
ncbi:hypothetical protein ABW20_dc0104942 [Dactylellina cionopaga]|nr:hypothetical protein ABW20_dc0104942 [Dactylellina cionopaga]